jgi:hypothetical protein
MAFILLASLSCATTLAPDVAAQAGTDSEAVVIDGRAFASYPEYFRSDYFRERGKRCATPAPSSVAQEAPPSDCSINSTNPDEEYAPRDIYEITVVVHVITRTNGFGDVSDALVHSQIDVLNEDFQAMQGTNGEGGTDCRIRFKLAETDPDGNPTNGITRSADDTWFNDGGAYWNTLAWDPTRYCNIYTNSAQGFLGYVPFLPQNGPAGSNSDRIVILWSAFGKPGQGGPPYDLGRTATHEMGHYLGLLHTFNAQGQCGSATAPGCYTDGDLICDTPVERSPNGDCTGSETSCGSPDPVENYLDYTDDICMFAFSEEQCNRMRCTLVHYRPEIYALIVTTAIDDEDLPTRALALHQNHPNPFNPVTRIRFELATPSHVSIAVFDVGGRRVRTLTDDVRGAGRHHVTWDGTDVGGRTMASGVYFYRLTAGGVTQTRRMVLLK